MRKIAREILISSGSLYLVSLFISGFKVQGGIISYFISGILILLADYILKPILNFISIPFNVLSLGLFSSVINAVTLYIITIIFPKIVIDGFYFSGIVYKTISIPPFYVTRLLSYLVISFIIQVIKQIVFWLIEER